LSDLGTPVFDLVLAYLVLLVAMSSLVSAVLQVLDRVLKLKHRWLRFCLRRMFRRVELGDTAAVGQTVGAFFADPAINPSGTRGLQFVDGAATVAWMRARNGGELPRGVPDPEAAPKAFDIWWDTFEDGATAGFARGMVGLGFAVGLCLAWGLRLDAIGIAQHLTASPEAVAGLVAEADGASPRVLPADESLRRGLVEALPACAVEAWSREPACVDRVAAVVALGRGHAGDGDPLLGLARDLEARAEALPQAPPLSALVAATRAALSDAALPAPVGPAVVAPVGEPPPAPAVQPSLSDRVLTHLGQPPDAAPAPLRLWVTATLIDVGAAGATDPARLLAARDGAALARVAVLDRDTLGHGVEATRAAWGRRADAARTSLLGFGGVWRADTRWKRVLGMALFALFVAGGAPIWFDLLNRLLAVRRGDEAGHEAG